MGWGGSPVEYMIDGFMQLGFYLVLFLTVPYLVIRWTIRLIAK